MILHTTRTVIKQSVPDQGQKGLDNLRNVSHIWVELGALRVGLQSTEAPLEAATSYGRVLSDPEKDTKYIPKIIHQTYSSESVPKVYANCIRSCLQLNPDWRYMFWSDQDARTFIRDKYPAYLSMFDTYNNKLMKADAMRYFVLDYYGGMYMDMDVKCLRPIKEYLADKRMVLVPEPHVQSMLLYKKFSIVTNAIMASEPSHPFLSYVIDQLQRFQVKTHVKNVIYVTGPNMLQAVLESYRDEYPCLVRRCNVFVADPMDLMPTGDSRWHFNNIKRFLRNCTQKTTFASYDEFKTCTWANLSNYQGILTDRAYTDHLWKHLGYRFRFSGQKVPIEEIVGKGKKIERYMPLRKNLSVRTRQTVANFFYFYLIYTCSITCWS
jgi:mannosyltransferase OCH1-like enzyme